MICPHLCNTLEDCNFHEIRVNKPALALALANVCEYLMWVFQSIKIMFKGIRNLWLQ